MKITKEYIETVLEAINSIGVTKKEQQTAKKAFLSSVINKAIFFMEKKKSDFCFLVDQEFTLDNKQYYDVLQKSTSSAFILVEV